MVATWLTKGVALEISLSMLVPMSRVVGVLVDLDPADVESFPVPERWTRIWWMAPWKLSSEGQTQHADGRRALDDGVLWAEARSWVPPGGDVLSLNAYRGGLTDNGRGARDHAKLLLATPRPFTVTWVGSVIFRPKLEGRAVTVDVAMRTAIK